MTTIDQIKSLMKSGDIAGAEALCKKALEADPDNAELKMRYGICRQLQGDEETFRRIHDELSPVISSTPLREGGCPEGAGRSTSCVPVDDVTLSLWRKYHKLWLSLIIGALVIGGAAAGVIMFGNEIQSRFNQSVTLYAGPKYDKPSPLELEKNLYGGPEYEDYEIRGE